MEKKLSKKIIKHLKKIGYCIHVPDVKSAGGRLDLYMCVDGKFYGIDFKVIKTGNIKEEKILSKLTPNQVTISKNILKHKGKVFIITFYLVNQTLTKNVYDIIVYELYLEEEVLRAKPAPGDLPLPTRVED